MAAKKSSNQPSKSTEGTMATKGALSKTRVGRLCCELNPLNKCKLCKVKFCYHCWLDDTEWLDDVRSFNGKSGSDDQVCNVCTEKWFVKNFYQKF